MGENKECEECYAYYIGAMEIIFGDNSQQVGECYFWLSQYYVEMAHYEKAKNCMIKTIQIQELETGDKKENHTEQIAEVHMNLGFLFKKQMIYEQALA